MEPGHPPKTPASSPDIAVKLGSASTDIMPFVANASNQCGYAWFSPTADVRQFWEWKLSTPPAIRTPLDPQICLETFLDTSAIFTRMLTGGLAWSQQLISSSSSLDCIGWSFVVVLLLPALFWVFELSCCWVWSTIGTGSLSLKDTILCAIMGVKVLALLAIAFHPEFRVYGRFWELVFDQFIELVACCESRESYWYIDDAFLLVQNSDSGTASSLTKYHHLGVG